MLRADDGFTLLEMIVALVLMSLAMAIVAKEMSNSRLADRTTQRSIAALYVARSKIAEIGSTYPLQVGRWNGKEANGIAWSITIDPYLADMQPEAFRSYFVRVSAWPEVKGGGAQVSLDTIKTTLAHGT